MILLIGLGALGVLLLLALYDPDRFHWPGRAAAGLVFLAFLDYLIDEIVSGHPWQIRPRSEPGPWNALVGLLVIGVPCLRYALAGRFGRKKAPQCEDTPIHQWLNGQCTLCTRPLAEHEWAGFASTVANEQNKERLVDFFGKVKEHDWSSLAQFQDFEATQDDMLVFAVRCISGGFVFVVRSPFELWQDEEMYVREIVTAAEMSAIESLIPSDTWHVRPSGSKNP